MNETNEDNLWEFYKSRAGAFDTFYFENINESPVTGITSTTRANGTNGAFSFPNFPWTSGDVTVYKNGASSGDYTITRATGTVTWPAGYYPASGDTITADYHYAYTVRFADDRLSRELFSFKLWQNQLKLTQVF